MTKKEFPPPPSVPKPKHLPIKPPPNKYKLKIIKVTHCKECNGKGMFERGVWAEGVDMRELNEYTVRIDKCKACNGTGHVVEGD